MADFKITFMKNRRLRLVIIFCLAPIFILAGLSLMSKTPTNLGVQDGKLAPCPNSPNCVSTQASDPAQKMDAIPFEGDPEKAMIAIQNALGQLPRTTIISEVAPKGYIRAECVSLIFRFVDDVELFVDSETKLIHFRSASRVGRSDLGVNRKRMQKIRDELVRSLTQE